MPVPGQTCRTLTSKSVAGRFVPGSPDSSWNNAFRREVTVEIAPHVRMGDAHFLHGDNRPARSATSHDKVPAQGQERFAETFN
jgi:metallophosphoesterase superfamily enzyme